MIAVEYAKEYNKLSPPKPVEFLEAFMLQVISHFRAAPSRSNATGLAAG